MLSSYVSAAAPELLVSFTCLQKWVALLRATATAGRHAHCKLNSTPANAAVVALGSSFAIRDNAARPRCSLENESSSMQEKQVQKKNIAKQNIAFGCEQSTSSFIRICVICIDSERLNGFTKSS